MHNNSPIPRRRRLGSTRGSGVEPAKACSTINERPVWDIQAGLPERIMHLLPVGDSEEFYMSELSSDDVVAIVGPIGDAAVEIVYGDDHDWRSPIPASRDAVWAKLNEAAVVKAVFRLRVTSHKNSRRIQCQQQRHFCFVPWWP